MKECKWPVYWCHPLAPGIQWQPITKTHLQPSQFVTCDDLSSINLSNPLEVPRPGAITTSWGKEFHGLITQQETSFLPVLYMFYIFLYMYIFHVPVHSSSRELLAAHIFTAFQFILTSLWGRLDCMKVTGSRSLTELCDLGMGWGGTTWS